MTFDRVWWVPRQESEEVHSPDMMYLRVLVLDEGTSSMCGLSYQLLWPLWVWDVIGVHQRWMELSTSSTTSSLCQGMSKTGSIWDVQVPLELQWIYKGALKGNKSLLNAWVEMLYCTTRVCTVFDHSMIIHFEICFPWPLPPITCNLKECKRAHR